MPLDTARARRYLKDFDLRTLFIEEMGWDHQRQKLVVPVDGQDFRLQAIAHKRGLVAFCCDPAIDGRIPPYALRRKIETQVAKSVNQHLIVYCDAGHAQQVWQWVKREAGRPTVAREQTFYRDQTGEGLIQRLQAVAFSLEEEERLTLVDVAGRVRAGFDVERVTKRFYERFRAEHAGFLKFVRGIPDETAQRWYVSVMINRLMFIYFIQKKGFLGSDPNYLRTRLALSTATAPGRYYADFLRPLFFQGFSRREGDRSAETNRLLGQVPYLDGGLFQEHPVERAYGAAIQIGDTAFERLFDFFDAYHWHLDERPLRADNEINPDVLGYIFEKYINQKQMGAYYTKEDITGYISQNTIIPYLLDAARRDCRVAFEAEHSVWDLLAADPDRYIYPAMRHGAELPLPPEIAAGVASVARRTEWNRPAPADYALPTEIWREVVARRQRYEKVKAKLAAGEVRQVNDLITYNLDLRQFAQDVISTCDDPELLRAFWKAIESITILDPTVGSGAFLFAALNMLEPLYEGCLERMQAFVDDLERSGEPHRPEKFSDFHKVLARVAQHPNRRYFILKSIVVNNLYGVDIMDEAVEICKLRMFLKLVAQVERVQDIEPLPDIDFNIRAGNTLVGFTTIEEVERAMKITQNGQGKLMFGEHVATLQRIEEKAADVDRLFGEFQAMQTTHDVRGYAQDYMETKEALRKRLQALEDELNRYLAQEYGADVNRPAAYQGWLASHQPFHWFTEFCGILRQGGFDVIIGNPPYVEYSKVRRDYAVREYRTESCGNLYAFVWERALVLLRIGGKAGMIVPSSAFTTARMQPLVSELSKLHSWFSFYDFRPSKLFEGVNLRLSICLAAATPSDPEIYSTTYNRWHTEAREYLFSSRLFYQPLGFRYSLPLKFGQAIEQAIYDKVTNCPLSIAHLIKGGNSHALHFHDGILYWIRATDFAPVHAGYISSHVKTICFNDRTACMLACSLMNSSLFYWWWIKISNCRDLNVDEAMSFSFPDSLLEDSEIALLHTRLMDDLLANSQVKTRIQKQTGEVNYREFYPVLSKTIIDQIDRLLAQHYGFTDEELDFIINYDIKYRMGEELFEEEE